LLVKVLKELGSQIADSIDSSAPSIKPSLSSLKAAERFQLVMHVHTGSETNLKGSLDANLDGRWLMPGAARRLACDAGLLVAILKLDNLVILCKYHHR